jgi:hypothetical protein
MPTEYMTDKEDVFINVADSYFKFFYDPECNIKINYVVHIKKDLIEAVAEISNGRN